MIDWRIPRDTATHQEKGWSFPSFEIQEYLLPLINVGFDYIDEYGATDFAVEDCIRMKGNIRYLLDSRLITGRSEIKYDAFGKGLITLDSKEIEQCLLRLEEAAEQCIATRETLRFYGD